MKLLRLSILILALLSMVSTKAFANNQNVAVTSDEGSQGTVMVIFYKNEGTLSFSYYPPGTMYSRPTGNPYFFIKGAFSQFSTPEWNKYAGIKKAVITPSMADYYPRSTAYWFCKLTEMEAVEGLENLNTGEITDMSGMFDRCSALKRLDLGGWDTRKVTQMGYMFNGCSSLEWLNISDFNTGCVEGMSSMFSGCSSLENIDVSCFNTHNVTTMNSMFNECSSVKSIDLSGFETDKVQSMFNMFYGCKELKELNLGSFNTSNVSDFSYMFAGCHALTKIIVSREGWTTEKIHAGAPGMFEECIKLTGGNGTQYDSNHIDEGYAHIDGGSGYPGYLTEDTNGQFKDNTGQTRAYCVLDNYVLTFYYDNKVNSRPGLRFPVEKNHNAFNMPQWYFKRPRVRKVVFDSSFAAFEPTSTARWFYDFPYLAEVVGASNLNTSQVTSMSEMFRFNSSLRSVDFSSWDTSKCTDMNCLFCLCTSLADINVSNFNTSQVTNMFHMFHACPLTTLDLRSFNTSKVTNMYWMFIESSVKTIYVSDKWSTESVTSSNEMFKGCKNLVGGMGTEYSPKHIDHEYAQIDGGMCDPGYLTGEYLGKREPYAVLNDSTLTFYYDWNMACRDGTVYPIGEECNRSWDYDCAISTKTVSFDRSFAHFRPIRTNNWFYEFGVLTKIENLENLNTSEVTDMSYMFFACAKLTALDLHSFDTQKVKNMFALFYGCSSLKNINVSSFNTSNVEKMGRMFCECKELPAVDVNNFNTSKVEDMFCMFARCEKLEELDLSHFDVSNVTSIAAMFTECRALKHLDISNFYTKKVEEYEDLFEACESLKEINVSSFDTRNATNIRAMFLSCISLEVIDISNFSTSNVSTMQKMFYDCRNLRTVYVGKGWSTENVIHSDQMFYLCKNLVGGAGTAYDMYNTDYTYAHVDGGPDNPGYLTYKEYIAPDGINTPKVKQEQPEDDEYYTLQGIRITTPTKGVYIRKGKKFYIK